MVFSSSGSPVVAEKTLSEQVGCESLRVLMPQGSVVLELLAFEYAPLRTG